MMLTYRRDGSPQMSPIACNVDADGLIVVSTRETAMKTQAPAPRPARVAVRDDRRLLRRLDPGRRHRRGRVAARRDGAPGRVLPLDRAASTPTGTTTAPRWCATSASSCASPPSAPVRTAPVDVAAAVLAAGRGSRSAVTTSKPLLEWRGRPLVRWALDAALASGLRPVVLVVGYRGRRGPRRPTPSRAREGRRGGREPGTGARGSRRACGPRSTRSTPTPRSTRSCVGLADQPLVGAEAYRRLGAAHADGASSRSRPTTGAGQPGASWRVASGPRRCELGGDEGARALMRRHRAVEVDCTAPASPPTSTPSKTSNDCTQEDQ